MHRAVDNSFKPGRSKHSATEDERNATTYSFRHEKNLNDFARGFSDYIREIHPDIRQVRDIKAEHVSQYLADKKADGLSDSTIRIMQSHAAKVGELASNLYKTDIDWSHGVNAPEKGLKTPQNAQDNLVGLNSLTSNQWESLKEQIQDKRGQSKDAILIAGAFGLRVSELTKLTAKDISVDGNLHIHQSKGGRDRDLEVRNDEQRAAIELIRSLSIGKAELQRIFTVENDSINKFYKEQAKAIGATKVNQYGIHQLRKMNATNYYHELRGNGLSEREAENKVSK